jgi:hypothetical protein
MSSQRTRLLAEQERSACAKEYTAERTDSAKKVKIERSVESVRFNRMIMLMRTKRWQFAALLFLAFGPSGLADEPKEEFKYVGHVVVVLTDPQLGNVQQRLQKTGDMFLSHLQFWVSPNVSVSYTRKGVIDYSVESNDRAELRRLMDEVADRARRPLHITFQMIATGEEYANHGH